MAEGGRPLLWDQPPDESAQDDSSRPVHIVWGGARPKTKKNNGSSNNGATSHSNHVPSVPRPYPHREFDRSAGIRISIPSQTDNYDIVERDLYGSAREQLAEMGRKFWLVEESGNSLFVSMSIQLGNATFTYKFLRHLVQFNGSYCLERYLPISAVTNVTELEIMFEALEHDDVWKPKLRDVVLTILHEQLNVRIVVIRNGTKPAHFPNDGKMVDEGTVVIVEDDIHVHYDSTRKAYTDDPEYENATCHIDTQKLTQDGRNPTLPLRSKHKCDTLKSVRLCRQLPVDIDTHSPPITPTHIPEHDEHEYSSIDASTSKYQNWELLLSCVFRFPHQRRQILSTQTAPKLKGRLRHSGRPLPPLPIAEKWPLSSPSDTTLLATSHVASIHTNGEDLYEAIQDIAGQGEGNFQRNERAHSLPWQWKFKYLPARQSERYPKNVSFAMATTESEASPYIQVQTPCEYSLQHQQLVTDTEDDHIRTTSERPLIRRRTNHSLNTLLNRFRRWSVSDGFINASDDTDSFSTQTDGISSPSERGLPQRNHHELSEDFHEAIPEQPSIGHINYNHMHASFSSISEHSSESSDDAGPPSYHINGMPSQQLHQPLSGGSDDELCVSPPEGTLKRYRTRSNLHTI